jgi:hypothetical protein
MSTDREHLPDERPATMDEKEEGLIFPAQFQVSANLRTFTEIFLVIFFLVLPWIKIGAPGAPAQYRGENSPFGFTFWRTTRR